MPQSIYDNGGMIGVTLDLADTDRYIVGSTTERQAPTYVGGAGDWASNGGAITLDLSGLGLQENDLLIIAVSAADSGEEVDLLPSEATLIGHMLGNDTEDISVDFGYYIVGPTPPTSISSINSGDSDNSTTHIVQAFRGVDLTYFVNSMNYTTNTSTNTAVASFSGINTTAIENSIVVALAASSQDAPDTYTPSANTNNFITTGGSDTYDSAAGMGWYDYVSSTSFDPGDWIPGDDDSGKASAAALIFLPAGEVSIPVYGNQKNSGIWSLGSVIEAISSNLEYGLTLTRTHAASGSITDNYGTINTVFAATLTFPTSPIDGLIWETGGTGQGAWLGIRDSGTTMRLRGGDGATSKTVSDTDTAVLDITDFPKDGQEHILVWDFNIATATVRIFIDGNLKGIASATGGTFDNNQFSGVASGAYLTDTDDVVTNGELATTSNFTEAGSGLRVYENELVKI